MFPELEQPLLLLDGQDSEIATDLPSEAEYEVRAFDTKRGCRLVAAVEIVSPAEQGSARTSTAFVAKVRRPPSGARGPSRSSTWSRCRTSNLYGELLELIGCTQTRF